MGMTSEEKRALKGGGNSHVAPIAYTIDDAAAASGLARSRLYALMGAGEIEHRKIGRRTMILARSLEEFIEKQPPAAISAPRAA